MDIVLDCNIYDLLYVDSGCLDDLKYLIDSKGWRVLAPATLVDELKASPFDVFDWMTITEEPDSVFVIGYTKFGTGGLGEGEDFSRHLGDSTKKFKDSVIVDFAINNADAFVSEDNRAISQLKRMDTNIGIYKFAEFKHLIKQSRYAS